LFDNIVTDQLRLRQSAREMYVDNGVDIAVKVRQQQAIGSQISDAGRLLLAVVVVEVFLSLKSRVADGVRLVETVYRIHR
jgi:hypothetical protein